LDTLAFPTAVSEERGGKHELGCAPLRGGGESNDGDNEEDDVENTTDDFNDCENLTRKDVGAERNQEVSPHEQSRVPPLGDVGLVVEDDQSLNTDCAREGDSCAETNP